MTKHIPSRPLILRAMLAVLAASTLLLAACGGGGGGGGSSASDSGGSSSTGSGGSGGSGSGGTTEKPSGVIYGSTCFSGTGSVTPGAATPPADLSATWPPPPCTPPTACSTALTGTHNTYNVGGGTGLTYTDMTNVPWLSLVAGDVVNIYYRATPYATKVAISAQGTATAPVIINGVTDANCNRPVITGVNAVTASDAISSHFFNNSGGQLIEGEGLFVVWWNGSNNPDPFGYKPSFIAIQNLAIENANAANTYTNNQGVVTNWQADASGIYVVVASVFTVQNCTITNNGEGVFVNSKNDTQDTSYFVTLRGNSIYNNGVVGDDHEHNIYVQGVRSLYEGNYIGQDISGSLGGSLKDRSSGTVVRYNSINSAARAIDLVDNEGGSPDVNADVLYNYAWIYGNLIVNGANGSSDLIHWGGDSTNYSQYHQGPLSAYFNTIANTTSTEIFDMSMSTQSANSHSNIIASTTSLGLCTASAQDGSQVGAVNLFDKNWIQPGFSPTGTDPYHSTPQCTYAQKGTLVAGSPQLTSSYGLPSGSPAIGAGVTFPSTSTSFPSPAYNGNLIPVYQPSTTSQQGYPTYVARQTTSDLGAFAGP